MADEPIYPAGREPLKRRLDPATRYTLVKAVRDALAAQDDDDDARLFLLQFGYTIDSDQYESFKQALGRTLTESNDDDILAYVRHFTNEKLISSTLLKVPQESALKQLRLDCEQWINLVESTFEPSNGARTYLLKRINDVIVATNDVLGTTVTRESEGLLGALMVATNDVPATKHAEWVTNLKKLATTIVIVGNAVSGLTAIAHGAESSTQAIESMFDGSSHHQPRDVAPPPAPKIENA